MKLTKFDKTLIILFFATFVGTAILGLCGCDTINVEGDTLPMNKITDQINQGQIGATGIPLNPSLVIGKTTQSLGETKGILQFRGQTEDPQVCTATLSAFDPGNTGAFFGPIVATIEWGAGNSATYSADVDVPSHGYSTSTGNNGGGIGSIIGSGGVNISVPCSSLQVKMRNDGALIPPIGDRQIGSTAAVAQGSAAMAVGNRAGNQTQLYRTIWGVNGTPGNGLANNLDHDFIIPPFATSVRFMRSLGGAIQVQTITMAGPAAVIDSINVAANAPCPEIALGGNPFVMRVKNTSGVEITQLYALYTISL